MRALLLIGLVVVTGCLGEGGDQGTGGGSAGGASTFAGGTGGGAAGGGVAGGGVAGGGVAGLVTVTNLQDGTELRYRLALLRGTVPSTVTSVSVIEPGGRTSAWPAESGTFKALVRLAPGDNALQLEAAGVRTPFTLRYRDSTNPRFVRIVYLVAADGTGTFDAPAGEPNDQASALARLRLAAELMQTLTAEKLEAQGLGRRTFRLERDPNGEVHVEVFRSALTMAQAHTRDGSPFPASSRPRLRCRKPGRRFRASRIFCRQRRSPPAHARPPRRCAAISGSITCASGIPNVRIASSSKT